MVGISGSISRPRQDNSGLNCHKHDIVSALVHVTVTFGQEHTN